MNVPSCAIFRGSALPVFGLCRIEIHAAPQLCICRGSMLPADGFSADPIRSACFAAPPAGAGSSKRLIGRDTGADGADRTGAGIPEFADFGISRSSQLEVFRPQKIIGLRIIPGSGARVSLLRLDRGPFLPPGLALGRGRWNEGHPPLHLRRTALDCGHEGLRSLPVCYLTVPCGPALGRKSLICKDIYHK